MLNYNKGLISKHRQIFGIISLIIINRIINLPINLFPLIAGSLQFLFHFLQLQSTLFAILEKDLKVLFIILDGEPLTPRLCLVLEFLNLN